MKRQIFQGAGCIIAEIFNGEPLFQGDREIAQLREILKILGVPQESDWPANTNVSRDSFENVPRKVKRPKLSTINSFIFKSMAEIVPRAPPYAQQLIKELLEFSFEKRPTAAAALKGPWFQHIGATIPEPQNSSSISTVEAPNNSSSSQNPDNSSNNSQNTCDASESTNQGSTTSSSRPTSTLIGSTRTRQSSETTTDELSVKRSRANT